MTISSTGTWMNGCREFAVNPATPPYVIYSILEPRMNWFRFALIALPVLVGAQQPGVVGSTSNQPQPANSPNNTQPTPPKDPCSVEGQVLNSLTGEPIRKAHITLQGMGSPKAASPSTYGGVTDAGGRFVIQDIEPGSYFAVAERNGFTNGQSTGWGRGYTPPTYHSIPASTPAISCLSWSLTALLRAASSMRMASRCRMCRSAFCTIGSFAVSGYSHHPE